jgi:hypothetical protein
MDLKIPLDSQGLFLKLAVLILFRGKAVLYICMKSE